MIKNIFLLIFSFSIITAETTKKIFNVEGMMCGYGCVNTIGQTLESLNGVKNYSVSFENKKMEVTYDDTVINSEKVILSLPKPYVATLLFEVVSKQYSVTGMTCMGCVNSIEKSLDSIDGIKTYQVDFDNSTLFIEFDPKKITDEKIRFLIPEKFQLKDNSVTTLDDQG